MDLGVGWGRDRAQNGIRDADDWLMVFWQRRRGGKEDVESGGKNIPAQDAHSFWNWIYFVMLIVIGSFFMINLCLVVIATQFRCYINDRKNTLWSCSFQWDKAARDSEDESRKSQVQLLFHPLIIHKRVTHNLHSINQGTMEVNEIRFPFCLHVKNISRLRNFPDISILKTCWP